jgi:hypothetical protein
MRWESEAKSFLPFPAQTGPWKGANQATSALGKPFDQLAHSTPDFSANATYILHSEGGVITVLYYHGNMATPYKCTDGTLIGQTDEGGTYCGVSPSTPGSPFGTEQNVDFDFSKANSFRNNFDRVAIYGSYPIGKHFLPMGGFNWGRDTNRPGIAAKYFDDKGVFAEGAYSINQYVTAGFRYDWFHPNVTKLNSQWAVTPYVNVQLLNGAQVIAEYQHRDFQLDAVHHRQNDTLQVRLIFIK